MHGIERTRKIPEKMPEQDQGISRVAVRYTDGRVLYFVPDRGGREVFDEDDLLELEKVLTRASSIAEWSEAGTASGAGG